jgi:hypothetical protein
MRGMASFILYLRNFIYLDLKMLFAGENTAFGVFFKAIILEPLLVNI